MQDFYRIQGRNGATFYLNKADRSSWNKSLEFYRAVSYSAKMKRHLLQECRPLLWSNCNEQVVLDDIAKMAGSRPTNLDHSSAMISPTRDKAVVHVHGKGYWKYANKTPGSSGSYPGVCEELKVYHLLAAKRPGSFAYSEIGEEMSTNTGIGFFMYYADGDYSEAVPDIESLSRPLLDFYQLNNLQHKSWRAMWDTLGEFQQYVLSGDMEGQTPVGLVHRDFKPWNVKSGLKPLFYDFEAVDWAGCPLEDLFNYVLEPIVRHASTSKVLKTLLRIEPLAQDWLRQLGIGGEGWQRYWRWYCLQRAWSYRHELAVSKLYLGMLTL